MDDGPSVAQARDDIVYRLQTEAPNRARTARLPGVFHRFLKFSAVGVGGVIVQTATLGVLMRVGGMHYLMATALAVEASVLNNFVWHRRWTWADRPGSRTVVTFVRFNATNGAMSLIGNLAIMLLLVSGLNLKPYVANLITIAFCSLINFALADRVVFT